MKTMIDSAVRGRSAARQVRITDLSDYTSEHTQSRVFQHFHWSRSFLCPLYSHDGRSSVLLGQSFASARITCVLFRFSSKPIERGKEWPMSATQVADSSRHSKHPILNINIGSRFVEISRNVAEKSRDIAKIGWRKDSVGCYFRSRLKAQSGP